MRPAFALLLAAVLAPACREQSRPLHARGGAEAFAVADSLRLLGNHAASLTHYARLRDSTARAGDSAALWRAELWWADGEMWLGHHDSADQGLARASALVGKDGRRAAWTHVVSSTSLDLRGRYDTALVEVNLARELARGVGDAELDAAVLDELGRIYAFTGRQLEAWAADSAALAQRRARGGEPRALLARQLMSVGLDQYFLGRHTEAIGTLEESLGVYEALGSDDGIARALTSLALVYQVNGNLDQALELLERAIPYGERANAGQLARMAVTYNNLGYLYIVAGNPRAARPYIERALEISTTTQQPYAGMLALMNRGFIARAAGDTGASDHDYRRAMELADSLGYYVNASQYLAESAANRGDRATARRLAAHAVRAADSVGWLAGEFDARASQGLVLEETGDTAGAIRTYIGLLDLLENMRGRVALGDLRAGITEPRLLPYEGLVRLHLRRGQVQQAFAVAERARARLLLEVMARREANLDPQSEEERWRERIREQISLAPDPAATETTVAALADTLAELEADVKRRDPAVGAARFPTPISLAEARRTLTGPGRGLLVYFWGDRDVYGWWIGHDTVRAARLGAADSLSPLVTFLHRLLQSPGLSADWAPAAHRVFEALVAPLTTADVEEMLVVPDGPLAQIPFEALVAATGQEPLGATRRIVFGPSASVLVALERAPPHAAWSSAMLAVGDPTSVPARKADPFRDSKAGSPGPLPYAADEARAVRDLFRSAGADLLVREDATLDHWLGENPGRYRYLHFAAHARVDNRRPERTHVLLSGAELDLTAIRRLRLNAELVTLSACETGLGRRYRGEGVIGLPHAFLAAGARAVIVTLWRVEDESAAMFMEEFYTHVAAGMDPAAALRAVRRRWIGAGGPRSHPARWAPFVLVGGLGERAGPLPR